MHHHIPAIVIVASAFSLGACGVPAMTASPERAVEARVLLEDLATGRDDVLEQKLSRQVDRAQFRAQLPFLKTLVPQGPVPEGQTMGWQANAGTGGTTYALRQTYDYPDRTLTVDTTFIKQGEGWKVLAFFISPTMKARELVPVVPEGPKAGETHPHSG